MLVSERKQTEKQNIFFFNMVFDENMCDSHLIKPLKRIGLEENIHLIGCPSLLSSRWR